MVFAYLLEKFLCCAFFPIFRFLLVIGRFILGEIGGIPWQIAHPTQGGAV